MSNRIVFVALRAPLTALAVAAAFWAVPAQAGFLDQLFGGGGGSAPTPVYTEPAAPVDGFDQLHVIPQHQPRRRTVLREATPVRQTPTDLMHDRTLRVGDAVMMKDGFHIYNGPRVASHSSRQFVPIDEASHVSASARETLAAIDSVRSDPLLHDHKPDTLASGRSAAVSTPISKGFKITDARGASIRYVGP